MESISSVRFENAKKKLKRPVIIDLRNIYNPTELTNMGFKYHSLGRSFA